MKLTYSQRIFVGNKRFHFCKFRLCTGLQCRDKMEFSVCKYSFTPVTMSWYCLWPSCDCNDSYSREEGLSATVNLTRKKEERSQRYCGLTITSISHFGWKTSFSPVECSCSPRGSCTLGPHLFCALHSPRDRDSRATQTVPGSGTSQEAAGNQRRLHTRQLSSQKDPL